MSISRINFKNFLLNEIEDHFSLRVSTILSAIQELLENSKGMGKRQIVLNCENIVSKIRSILQDKWNEKQKKYVKKLQKCGVAIAKCIDDKGDLLDVLEASLNELQDILSDMGNVVNSIGNSQNDKDDSSSNEEQPSEEELNDNQDGNIPDESSDNNESSN